LPHIGRSTPHSDGEGNELSLIDCEPARLLPCETPLQANFEDNAVVFSGLGVLHRLWTEGGAVSHRGKYYEFDSIRITRRL
jgi:hypothetical protein